MPSWLRFLIWAHLSFFIVAIEDEEGSGSFFVALFVHCLEVCLCGFLDLVWLSWFLVGGCCGCPGF
jgi:hypothetical protein